MNLSVRILLPLAMASALSGVLVAVAVPPEAAAFSLALIDQGSAAEQVAGVLHASSDDDRLATIADEPFVFRPSVSAELVFPSSRSEVGWGSFDLTAAPEHDEIRVDLLLGKASQRAVWRRCHALELLADGRSIVAATQYAGVPMARGMWDAVTAKLTIAEVRDLRSAQVVEARVCGDQFELPSAQRARLSDFVRRFDETAMRLDPSAPIPKPELDDDHDFFPFDFTEIPAPT